MALVFRVGVVGRCLRISTVRISCENDGKKGRVKVKYVPMSVPFDGSARIPWIMGYENLPSVRSSAKPLLWVYYRI